MLKSFKGIRPNVVVLGVASFFTDVSSEMLYPIIPIFLTSVLGAPMSIVGLIEGIAESTASILKAASGWMSDKIRKRLPFVVGGYSLSSFAKPVLFFAYAWPIVLLSRFLDRFGKGLQLTLIGNDQVKRIETGVHHGIASDRQSHINHGRAASPVGSLKEHLHGPVGNVEDHRMPLKGV